MSEAQFVNQLRNWLNHKIILSRKSEAYIQDKKRKNAAINLTIKFSNFLNYPRNYSVGQLAIMIKRHEDLLASCLPIPQNPAYETSLATLEKLIDQAQKFINQYNLSL